MQTLIATALRLEHLRSLGDENLAELDRLADTCRMTVDGLRSLVSDLRSPMLDDRDLRGALLGLLPTDDTITTYLDVDEGLVLPGDIATELYRIAQAAVTNVLQHAEATRLEVEVRRDSDQLTMRIEDNGKGVDQSLLPARQRAGHLGLVITQERVTLLQGTLRIDTALGAGFRLEVTLPLEAETLARDSEVAPTTIDVVGMA
jgi:signal transduction histidine kinase